MQYRDFLCIFFMDVAALNQPIPSLAHVLHRFSICGDQSSWVFKSIHLLLFIPDNDVALSLDVAMILVLVILDLQNEFIIHCV